MLAPKRPFIHLFIRDTNNRKHYRKYQFSIIICLPHKSPILAKPDKKANSLAQNSPVVFIALSNDGKPLSGLVFLLSEFRKPAADLASFVRRLWPLLFTVRNKMRGETWETPNHSFQEWARIRWNLYKSIEISIVLWKKLIISSNSLLNRTREYFGHWIILFNFIYILFRFTCKSKVVFFRFDQTTDRWQLIPV